MITKNEFKSLFANFDGTYCHVPDDDELPILTPIRDGLLVKGLLFINNDGKYECTELGKQAIDEYVKENET